MKLKRTSEETFTGVTALITGLLLLGLGIAMGIYHDWYQASPVIVPGCLLPIWGLAVLDGGFAGRRYND